jgi:hypothetical protein
MSKKNLAGVAWLIAIGGLVAYEGWSLINGIPGDTLSELVWSLSGDHPYVPFAGGFLAGHFFWQRRRCKECGKRPW